MKIVFESAGKNTDLEGTLFLSVTPKLFNGL